jgi:hypothetical protein
MRFTSRWFFEPIIFLKIQPTMSFLIFLKTGQYQSAQPGPTCRTKLEKITQKVAIRFATARRA